jgi:hypothetical protein
MDNEHIQGLDATLLKFQNFFHRAEIHLMKECATMNESKQLQQEAWAIDEEFAQWGESVSNDNSSYLRITIASLDESAVALSGRDYCHSGSVDKYSNCASTTGLMSWAYRND